MNVRAVWSELHCEVEL